MRALEHRPRHPVAVILNANAKRVTPQVQARLEAQCEGLDIYYSRSLEEAQLIARQVIELGYETVLTGGGDGTIIQTINSLFKLTGRVGSVGGLDPQRHLRMLKPVRPMPTIGVLKLGTGNALATVVGAGRYDADARAVRARALEGLDQPRLSLSLMENEGDVFPFAGLGWDAAILNDYNVLKERYGQGALKGVFKSVLGYLAAGLCITGPNMMRSRSPEVEVRALAEATLLDENGGVARRYAPGSVLYRGPVNMLSFATMQYYGYRFRMFPFADAQADRFQLRLVTCPVTEVVSHLPSIWNGTYRSPRIMDFLCDRVTMAFSEPQPFHVGGDARGKREHLTLGMSPYRAELLDYRHSVVPSPLGLPSPMHRWS